MRQKTKVDFIASHGHTIFHQPDLKLTHAIGDAQKMAKQTGLSVINDFRSKDVSLGGQGAPLVPIGEKLLFRNHDAFLNLGGIANLTIHKNETLAFDVGPFNQVLNFLSQQLKKEYDANGDLARRGSLSQELLIQLNSLPYYNSTSPKSLGRENIETDWLPIFEKYDISVQDKLHTFCVHIAQEISKAVPQGSHKLLVTGGGTFNTFFIELLKQKLSGQVVMDVPDKRIIEFKEAIIFAFLGILRWRREVNCLASVTGAVRNSCGGVLHFP